MVGIFEAWCAWAKMDIRLDKCSTFGMSMGPSNYQQTQPTIVIAKGIIQAVPDGGHFTYLGRVFDFDMKDEIPKKVIVDRLDKILNTISVLNIKTQTKLKIFSRYVPSQIMFDLKIYSFSPTFISNVIDVLCTAHIRRWLECPASSCITEWMSSPTKFCGLGIPTFAHRAERLLLGKRNALKNSRNTAIRELWSDTIHAHANQNMDNRLISMDFQSASKQLTEEQSSASLTHFLGLESQGRASKIIGSVLPAQNINNWKVTLEKLPTFIFNFVRKAMTNQLPTLRNLQIWGCSPTDACPHCGRSQTNKHVLSNCSAPEALARYLERHNKILRLLVDWLKDKIGGGREWTIYCDLDVVGTRHVSDLFVGVRPDLAIVNSNKVLICELTVCHETNLEISRAYKINKYSNIASARSSMIKNHVVKVCTMEVTTMGFVALDPIFLKESSLPKLNKPALENIH